MRFKSSSKQLPKWAIALIVIVVVGIAAALIANAMGVFQPQREEAEEPQPSAVDQRFTVEGAPLGVKSHLELVTATASGKHDLVIFEGDKTASFEVDPVKPADEEAAKQAEEAKKAEEAQKAEEEAKKAEEDKKAEEEANKSEGEAEEQPVEETGEQQENWEY